MCVAPVSSVADPETGFVSVVSSLHEPLPKREARTSSGQHASAEIERVCVRLRFASRLALLFGLLVERSPLDFPRGHDPCVGPLQR